MAVSSSRRFDIGSAAQPIQQFIFATLPFFILLLWFLYQAYRRPNTQCYQNDPGDFDDDQAKNELGEACSQLIPLVQFVYVFLGVAFCWTLLAVYVTFYIPRRHKLVEAYLRQGETVIGDVIFGRNTWGIMSLTSYGHVEYTHPDKDKHVTIRRKVHLYERYSRELTAILYLPGQPTSGQPKLDLEIDRDVSELNSERLQILLWYSWAWSMFCLVAPLYILKVMNDLAEEGNEENVWQPENNVDVGNFVKIYCILAYVVIPATSLFINLLAWFWHKRSMTVAHTLKSSESATAEQNQQQASQNALSQAAEVSENIAASYEPPAQIPLAASSEHQAAKGTLS